MISKFRMTGATYIVPLLICILLVPAAWGGAKYKVLHDFGAGNDGTVPDGALLLDGNKNLYGNTSGGGSGSCSDYGCGTVFELSPRSNGMWREKVLHDFTAGNDGALPWGGLVRDEKGDLYGTLIGDNGLGGSGVFELIPRQGGWSNTLVYTQGAGPGLLMDKLGNLYGEMGPGNYFGIGAIGELSPSTKGWMYRDLANLSPTVGYAPPSPPSGTAKAICLARQPLAALPNRLATTRAVAGSPLR
jgi:uncharacterized repeat protein (TIGR03803 family)